MPQEGLETVATRSTLFTSDDVSPFAVVHEKANRPVLLVCDHASRRIPESLGNMGLDRQVLRSHLGSDIGAGHLTTSLAASLSVTAVLCQYSRLVVDCNRRLDDAELFLQFSDNVRISGNCDMPADDRNSRINEIYWPYHNAIEAQLCRLQERWPQLLFVSIHSFSPILDSNDRPWEIGILWDADRPTARDFLQNFQQAGFVVGDNEPYSGKAPQDFTIDHHAEAIGLPHVGIEIRQDLIDSDEGVEKIRECLHNIIESICSRMEQAEDHSG